MCRRQRISRDELWVNVPRRSWQCESLLLRRWTAAPSGWTPPRLRWQLVSSSDVTQLNYENSYSLTDEQIFFYPIAAFKTLEIYYVKRLMNYLPVLSIFLVFLSVLVFIWPLLLCQYLYKQCWQWYVILLYRLPVVLYYCCNYQDNTAHSHDLD